MTMLRNLRAIVMAVGLPLLVSAQTAGAQRYGVGAIGARSMGRSDLGTLGGAQGVLQSPFRGAEWLRLGFTYLTRGGESFGSPCVGLVRPGTCGDEPLDETRRLMLMSLGVGRDVVHGKSAALHLAADAMLGVAYTRDRGRTSGQARTGSAPAAGITPSLEVWWWPSASSRLGLYSGVSAAFIKPLSVGDCVDCFTPFPESFGLARGYAGIAIGRVGR